MLTQVNGFDQNQASGYAATMGLQQPAQALDASRNTIGLPGVSNPLGGLLSGAQQNAFPQDAASQNPMQNMMSAILNSVTNLITTLVNQVTQLISGLIGKIGSSLLAQQTADVPTASTTTSAAPSSGAVTTPGAATASPATSASPSAGTTSAAGATSATTGLPSMDELKSALDGIVTVMTKIGSSISKLLKTGKNGLKKGISALSSVFSGGFGKVVGIFSKLF